MISLYLNHWVLKLEFGPQRASYVSVWSLGLKRLHTPALDIGRKGIKRRMIEDCNYFSCAYVVKLLFLRRLQHSICCKVTCDSLGL
jgi:hypothetical protein